MSTYSLLRAVIRTLRYETLSGAIGRDMTLTSTDSAPQEIVEALAAVIPEGLTYFGPDAESRTAAVGKYGLLDLSYTVDVEQLEWESRGGRGLLEERRYVLNATDLQELDAERTAEDEEFDREFYVDSLERVVEDARKNKNFVKLFLRSSEAEGRLERKRSLRFVKEGLPSDWWPLEFQVTDACVTNADSAWFFKHFYL